MGRTPIPHWQGSIPRQRFDNLLWTWHVQVHRRRIPIQLHDWITPDGQLDMQTLEEKYGIGEPSDRKAILDTALSALQNKFAPVDFDQIWRILNNAKTALVQWYVDNNAIDDRRLVDAELNVVLGHLHQWAGRAERRFRLMFSADGSTANIAHSVRPKTSYERRSAARIETRAPVWKPALKLAQGKKPEIVQCLDALMVLLDDDPLFRIWREQPSTKSSPSLYRRPREGAPSPKGSILTPATRALAKAGATGWIRESLLDATALTRLALNRK